MKRIPMLLVVITLLSFSSLSGANPGGVGDGNSAAASLGTGTGPEDDGSSPEAPGRRARDGIARGHVFQHRP